MTLKRPDPALQRSDLSPGSSKLGTTAWVANASRAAIRKKSGSLREEPEPAGLIRLFPRSSASSHFLQGLSRNDLPVVRSNQHSTPLTKLFNA
jgi:hypothetical protein